MASEPLHFTKEKNIGGEKMIAKSLEVLIREVRLTYHQQQNQKDNGRVGQASALTKPQK